MLLEYTCFFLSFILFASVSDIYGKEYLLNKNNFETPLGQYLSILEDTDGILTIEQVLDRKNQKYFLPSAEAIPNLGFRHSVYWVKFKVKNVYKENRYYLKIAYPKLDKISFYEIENNNIHPVPITTGDTYIFSKRPILNRNFVFPITINKDSAKEFYIRFETLGSHQYPIYIVSEKFFHETESRNLFFLGMYYGIVVILAVYNLILFLITKDRSHLYYLLFITGYATFVMNLNGLSFQILWPEQPHWENISLPFFIGWAFFWSVQFARSYLDVKRISKFMDKILISMMGFLLILMLMPFFLDYYYSIIFSAVLVIAFSAAVTITVLISLKNHYRPARYFFIAWTLFILGVVIYPMKAFGIFESNLITEYGIQFGSAIEMGLLSLGLADRINFINEESHHSRFLAEKNERLYQNVLLKSTRLEMELLKKNIEPHFMLNSINATVMWMEENPATAVRLLTSLADELRAILDLSGKQLIPIEDEFKLCKSHLMVMSLRQDKNFTLETKGNFENDMIPPLIFHTIIENGVSHGFLNQDSGHFIIEKKITVNQDTAYIISNNGSNASKKEDEGVGYRYIRTRLEETWPHCWSLDYGPTEFGWMVSITIRGKEMNENINR